MAILVKDQNNGVAYIIEGNVIKDPEHQVIAEIKADGIFRHSQIIDGENQPIYYISLFGTLEEDRRNETKELIIDFTPSKTVAKFVRDSDGNRMLCDKDEDDRCSITLRGNKIQNFYYKTLCVIEGNLSEIQLMLLMAIVWRDCGWHFSGGLLNRDKKKEWSW